MPTTPLLGSYGDISGSGLMFRNKLINGGFDIWQRGTSQTATGYGSDDRWRNEHSGSTKTVSRQTFTLGQTDVPGNPTYFSRTVVSSVANAANFVFKQQRIESVATLAGQPFTFSFWAKADASKNIAFEMGQYFGTGGSPSANNQGLNVTTISLTTTWQKFTINGLVPSISGKTLGTDSNDYLDVRWWFDAGSAYNARTNSLGQQSGTFDIANVQLEAGPVASSFEQRPIGTELALCQRYYLALGKEFLYNTIGLGFAGSATGCDIYVPLPVKMRIAPQITPQGSFQLSDTVTGNAVSAISAKGSSNASWLGVAACTSSGLTQFRPYRLEALNSTTAYLEFSAEL